MIESIFKKLNPYLRGIKKADEFSVIEVHMKNTWTIPSDGVFMSQLLPTKIEKGWSHYMLYSETESFDNLIDWFSVDVVDMNIEVEQKEELLKEKVAQLKEVFETSTLDELKVLRFSSDTDVLKLGGQSKNNNTDKEEKSKVVTEDKKKPVEA
jgi:hypothetical protein